MTKPALDEAARARAELARRRDEAAPPVEPAVPDPLRYCIWATVALLCLVFTPGLMLVWFGALGFAAYFRAYRAGLRRTQCWLREPRWAMLYLGLLAAAGAAWCVWRFR